MQKLNLPTNTSRPRQFPSTKTLAILGIVVLAGLFAYGFVRINTLSQNIQELTKLVQTANDLQEEVNENVQERLSGLQNVDVALSRAYSLSDQNIQEQVGQISSTVEILDKLSKTDPELLQKYSKIYFLNEHYTPLRLTQIENQYVYPDNGPEQIHAAVSPYLENLLQAVQSQGINVSVLSAYRSFDEQKYLKSSYTVTYGAGTANQFSADQGYSEHQLGTTVDLTTNDLNGQLDGFENTQAYEWMRNNAHKYGFTLSYPENNAYYVFEPWHWRYVGVRLATYLHDNNKHFYDLDQREIDEYLVSLFEENN